MPTMRRAVLPRTIESSTRSTSLPSNSSGIGFSFRRIEEVRRCWFGMMKVRPM
jgi:hypothetical protein